MSTFKISVDLGGLSARLDAAKEDVAESIRPAAQAGAQVLYDEVTANATRRKKTGNLAASIYQAFSADKSGIGFSTYHISWNRKKAPHGHLVEFGHYQRYEVTHDPKTGRFITHKDRKLDTPIHIAAKPFLRPAKDKAPQAIEAMERRFFEELKKRGVTK